MIVYPEILEVIKFSGFVPNHDLSNTGGNFNLLTVLITILHDIMCTASSQNIGVF